MKKHMVTLHIMWYESEMIRECFDSLMAAEENAQWPVEYSICFNLQTYLESPIEGTPHNMVIDHFMHPIFKQKNKPYVYIMGNDSPFYNIGDWRRDIVNEDEGYTIWAETDSLMPKQYFPILEMIHDSQQFKTPHCVSFASRKCWDETWRVVEHPEFHQYAPNVNNGRNAPTPFNFHDYITQEQLDAFNENLPARVMELPTPKIDGSLLALTADMPQLVPDDLHFTREDFCVQRVMEYLKIPQLHVYTILKGHNYEHPKKRTNTPATRSDAEWIKRDEESYMMIHKFLAELRDTRNHAKQNASSNTES